MEGFKIYLYIKHTGLLMDHIGREHVVNEKEESKLMTRLRAAVDGARELGRKSLGKGALK